MQLANILDFVVLMPLGPRLQTELHLTARQFAQLVSAYTFSAGISGFLAAFFIDRFDRKAALLFLLAGFTMGTGWCAIANGFSGLMLARIVAGAFGGVMGSLVTAIVADVMPPQDRGKAMGFLGAAFPVASVLGLPLALWLVGWQGWQAPFFWLVGLATIAWLLAAFFVPSMKGHRIRGQRAELPVAVIKRTFTNGAMLLGLGLMGAQVLGHFTLVPLLSTYLINNVGFIETQLSLVYIVGGLLQVFVNPLAGFLADKYGKAAIYMIFCATSVLPIVLLSHLGHVPLWQALSVTGMFFILSGTRFIPGMALLNDQVDAAHRGSYMGFVSCVQQVASGMASYIAGYLVVQGVGPKSPLEGFEYIGYFCLFFTAVAALFASRLRKPGATQVAVPVEYE